MDRVHSSFGNAYKAAETVATINSWGQWVLQISAISQWYIGRQLM